LEVIVDRPAFDLGSFGKKHPSYIKRLLRLALFCIFISDGSRRRAPILGLFCNLSLGPRLRGDDNLGSFCFPMRVRDGWPILFGQARGPAPTSDLGSFRFFYHEIH
jgi:hypothetical protein